jgi:hypothetical protein
MTFRMWVLLPLVGGAFLAYFASRPAQGCCPAPRFGQPVVNADQTVILIWDAATKTEHFIRQASFKSEAEDFGFLVPSPSQPELEESGNEAFGFLLKLTEPEVKKVRQPSTGVGCGCGADIGSKRADTAPANVRVLEEKLVAGFNAVVLEADSTTALVGWLKTNGYAFSPEVEAWAKPYVESGWKITALKVAKSKDQIQDKTVAASALRMSFKTDRPLFPYREPDYKKSAQDLGAKNRLLRIYFVGEARYQGDLTADDPWTGRVAWAGKLQPKDRKKALELLKLPEKSTPPECWLTEFEDEWPYRVAPADVYFSRSSDQKDVRRPPIYEYVSLPYPTDAMTYALGAVILLPLVWRRLRRA